MISVSPGLGKQFRSNYTLKTRKFCLNSSIRVFYSNSKLPVASFYWFPSISFRVKRNQFGKGLQETQIALLFAPNVFSYSNQKYKICILLLLYNFINNMRLLSASFTLEKLEKSYNVQRTLGEKVRALIQLRIKYEPHVMCDS